MAEKQKEELEESFKIGRNVKNPHDKLHICTDYGIKDDIYCNRFMSQYRAVKKRDMVWVENFREDTR